MKKLIAFLLAMIMMMGLVACAPSDTGETTGAVGETTGAAEQTTGAESKGVITVG